jgi:hypothetical protein
VREVGQVRGIGVREVRSGQRNKSEGGQIEYLESSSRFWTPTKSASDSQTGYVAYHVFCFFSSPTHLFNVFIYVPRNRTVFH